ncbi:GNAT family N-acetyltransferase [Anaerocolumna sedimenticola]|uniref:GNAT family N-acetyltransferase n=1 Tax=Anaerocolumna sedimenticola TaxID=2696063 RepID=A0A6P1TIG9_9FIRM|nr:GNAT family N-acetyltransferase [Anaerocolumna sedimenticola]QHQ59882.1 GNAT family N-acetyltransferase [Anaerocolumna sedimenticola]
MEIEIIKGSLDYLEGCEEALDHSELGDKYFSDKEFTRKALEEGFEKDEIFIAVDKNKKCLGFIWFIMNGIFHSFPYLHVIAVNEESRGQGIGKQLLIFFEDYCFKTCSKVFLVVADFNPDAKRLYESIGYIEVGVIPGLYREGITEQLMMKLRE